MEKLQRFIQSYFDYFDNRMSDTTIMVWLVGVLIMSVCYIAKTDASYHTASVMDISSSAKSSNAIVYIDGVPYKIHFEPLQ